MSDNKSTYWSITINNPTADDREAIATARSRGWQVEGQIERAESTGTIHLQLRLRTPHIRFGAVKKVFKRAHIEAARNPAALKNYVHKEETRVEELDAGGDMFPSMSRYTILVLQQFLSSPWDDKDGLHCDALERGEIAYYRFYDPDAMIPRERGIIDNPDEWLEMLDDATAKLVLKGFHVERYAVNPQFRSSWKKFAPQMLGRALAEWIAETSAAAAAAAAIEEQHVRIATALDSLASEHTQDAVCPPPQVSPQAQVDPSPPQDLPQAPPPPSPSRDPLQ